MGGAFQPVVHAVRAHQPTYVLFVASKDSKSLVDGPGTPCKDRREDKAYPSIVQQTGLADDEYEVIEGLDEADNLALVYRLCDHALKALCLRFPGARLVADYTAGTKSMGIGLALAAVEHGWVLTMVKTHRDGFMEVIPGTEVTHLINLADVRARRQLAEARRLFNLYAYASAAALLDGLSTQGPLPAAVQEIIQDRLILSRGLDAWDKFAHKAARTPLRVVAKHMVPQWIFLKALTDGEPGYALVLDLLRNAERRAARGRYDDAVARIYRALELLAQVRLREREPSLDSHDLDVNKLPEPLRPTYEALRGPGGVIRISLRQDYELLSALDDPLGALYEREKAHLWRVMEVRNASILAHGLTPIGEGAYREVDDLVRPFFAEALDLLGVNVDAPQFPRWEE
jgi:hypothetical protein